MEIERAQTPIYLQKEDLLHCIQKAFPDCCRLDEWAMLNGGALNTIYKFKIGNEEFVLRIYARDRASCKTEKELHALIDAIIPTPKLIYADENNEPWSYSIFQFIEGIPISKVGQGHTNTLSYDLGKTLALIHSFKFDQAGLFENGLKIGKVFASGSSPYFEEAMRILSEEGYAKVYLGTQLVNEMASFMLQNKDYFPQVNNNICLTHSDYKPVNLLYDAHGKIFVLDWEFAHAGMGILDFALLLRHREGFPFELQALKRGYVENGGILPKEWLRSAMITDFVNILTMINTSSNRPKLFRELKKSIEKTIRSWDSQKDV